MSETPSWFVQREVARKQGVRPRCWGQSSDALALYGLGVWRRPQTPGVPHADGIGVWFGDECGDNYPHDVGDLNACERTFEMAPPDVREVMLPVLLEFRQWVLHGVNRHGDRLMAQPNPLQLHKPAEVQS